MEGRVIVELRHPALYTVACPRPEAQSTDASGSIVNARKAVHVLVTPQYLAVYTLVHHYICRVDVAVAYARFLEALDAGGFKYKPNGPDRVRAQCPGHGGEGPNLAVAIGDQGVLLKCHSHDCAPEDIARAVGLELSDLFDVDGRAVYDYGGGHTVYRSRVAPGVKKIAQQKPPGIRTTLYLHPDSQPFETAEVVAIVEGEKCVDAALRLGLPCVTTWPMGAANVDKVDLDPLLGKRVRLIADNDEPGIRAMSTLRDRLMGIATIDSIMTVPNKKQDIADLWLDGGSLKDLIPLHIGPYEEAPEKRPVLTSLKSVKSRKARFLWEDIIPLGYLSLMAGMGGTGKSTLAMWLAAGVTKGKLPGFLYGEPRNVLYVSHEDSMEEIVKPRAVANQMDLDYFHNLMVGKRDVAGVSLPSFPDDLDVLRQAIVQTDARFVIIDPITSTSGDLDNDKVKEVRKVLNPLNALAIELGVSILTVTHLNKSSSGSSSHMISGSHAFRDVPRSVMLFAKDKRIGDDETENPPTVMKLDKLTVGPSGQSYGFRTDEVEVWMEEDEEMGKTTKVTWMGLSKRTFEDVVAGSADYKQGELANQIKEFIDAQPGAIDSKTIIAQFPNEKQGTIYANLKRLRERGVIHQPAYGIYQSMRFAPKEER